MPGSRSNHIELYINNNYHGLYLNVEHTDEEFVDSRFDNNTGNLYKCLWPATLEYLGQDPNLYKFESNGRRAYDLKTNTAEDDYSDIAHFIDILNNTNNESYKCKIEEVFNVYDYVKIAAADVMFGNWDGYIYNKNNFYLYNNTQSGKFEYIHYDLDNTIGIDWMDRDWGTRDIYDWQQHGGEQRPLYTRLMDNQAFRDQYSGVIQDIIDGYFDNVSFKDRILAIKDKITPFVESDPFYPLDYGYTINDFHNSYTQPLGGHVDYGLLQYLEVRANSATGQLQINNEEPAINYVKHNHPSVGEDLWIRNKVTDDSNNISVDLVYSLNGNPSQTLEMYDDGLHNDGNAGDNIYGVAIENITNNSTIDFNIKATDSEGLSNQIPCDPFHLEFNSSAGYDLFINEFCASNATIIADEFGEYDDWIEIYNAGNEDIWLGDKYLSDNFNDPSKWQFPDITLSPEDFLLVWADNDPEQGELHTNFKLNKSGEEIGIFDTENTGFEPIDQIEYNEQTTDISYGRINDGATEWIFFDTPTPGGSNGTAAVVPVSLERKLNVYPNPVKTPEKLNFNVPVSGCLYNSYGKETRVLKNQTALETKDLTPGFYLIRTIEGKMVKIIIN